MEKFSRSVRRHHRERLKNNRKNYHNGPEWYKDQVSIWVNTPTPCSCWGCGNPRKYFNSLTIQEKRFYCEEVQS